jgi:protein gp37
MSKRLAGRFGYPKQHPFSVTLHPDKLDEPRHWKKPRRVFVGSMTDLFHPDVPFDFLERMWDVMWQCPQHTFLILTKRPKRLVKFIRQRACRRAFDWTDLGRSALAPEECIHFDDLVSRNQCGWFGDGDWQCLCPANNSCGEEESCSESSCPIAYEVYDRPTLERIGVAKEREEEFDKDGYLESGSGWMELHTRPRHAFAGNCWFGITAENQAQYIKRMREFRQLRWECPKETILFASLEPLLAPLDFAMPYWPESTSPEGWNPLTDTHKFQSGSTVIERRYLDWVIVGAETGPGKRRMAPEWARGVRDQCRKADVPFFLKKLTNQLTLDGAVPREFPEAAK